MVFYSVLYYFNGCVPKPRGFCALVKWMNLDGCLDISNVLLNLYIMDDATVLL